MRVGYRVKYGWMIRHCHYVVLQQIDKDTYIVEDPAYTEWRMTTFVD